MKIKTVKIRILCILSTVLVFFGNDVYQYMHGRDLRESLIRSLYFLIFFALSLSFSSKFIRTFLVSALILIQTSESFCFFFTGTAINFQFLSHIDFNYGFFELQKEFALIMFLLIVDIVYSFYFGIHVNYQPNAIFLLAIMSAISMIGYYNIIKKSLYPLSRMNNSYSFHQQKFIARFLENRRESLKIISKPKKLKNLVVLVLESFELQHLGPFNIRHKKLMPFLSNSSTIITNVIPQPGTLWSISSLFAAQCGLPLIQERRSDQGRLHTIPGFHCLNDFLVASGYKGYAVFPGYNTIGSMRYFLQMHNYSVHSQKQHGIIEDKFIFKYVEEKFIPNVLKKNQPFNLIMLTADTHYGRHTTNCNVRIKEKIEKVNKAFDCEDQYIEHFIQTLKKEGLYDNTVIAVYGDHFLMSGRFESYQPRTLTMLFPNQNYGIITKNASLYDFAPSVLDLLGIKYQPQFLFGRNLFEELRNENKTKNKVSKNKNNDNILRVPRAPEFRVLYDFIESRNENIKKPKLYLPVGIQS